MFKSSGKEQFTSSIILFACFLAVLIRFFWNHWSSNKKWKNDFLNQSQSFSVFQEIVVSLATSCHHHAKITIKAKYGPWGMKQGDQMWLPSLLPCLFDYTCFSFILGHGVKWVYVSLGWYFLTVYRYT